MSSYLSSLVELFSGSCWLKRPPACAAGKSSSKVAVHTGEKLFKVYCHTSIKETMRLSECFHVGGYDWAVCYIPDGVGPYIFDAQFTSVFLMLMSDCETKDPSASPATAGEKNIVHFTHSFRSKGANWGLDKFVSRAYLTALEYLKDDCLVIKCNLEVIDENGENAIDSIIVPPSSLNTDLRILFDTGHKADLTINIVGSDRSFKVHGCMLAAQSPVFRALLCGSMLESKQTSLSIDDMDADIFVLVYYMYNNCLPEFMDEATEEAANMAQHLFVAADRYGVERLKIICDGKLSKSLDVDTMGFILDLAERYNSCHLKAHCLKYIEMNAERLGTIENTQ
ncbi:hypothetical protein ACQ4PT_000872 [Festuca glaucescens]